MNLLSLPEPASRSEDDLDLMLRDFFQAEMPNPWPAFEGPPATLPLPVRGRSAGRSVGRSVWRSRLALAASVALLLAGPLLLSGRLADPGPGTTRTMSPAEATKLPIPQDKNVEPVKPGEGDEKSPFDFDEVQEVRDGTSFLKVTGHQRK